jgi:hypothetical protein
LPREFRSLVGKQANIYVTEDIGKLAIKVVIDKKVDKVCANAEKSGLEDRLKDLESQISELKSLLLLNESDKLHKNKKEDEHNGLGRIRTGDLRRVNTGDLALFVAFSDFLHFFRQLC